MDLEGRVASNWAYLLGKYDADGDQRVEASEYDRDSKRFTRLDLNADGVLSVEDFPVLDEDSFRGFYQGQRAQRVLAMHFQADDDDGELRLDELEWMITAYDADYDEAIDASEFAASADEHRRELDDGDRSGTEGAMMGDYDPWDVLAEAADGDDDGRLTASEMVSFFQSRCQGGEILDLRSEAMENRWTKDTSGVAAGEWAPDFSLEPPHGGERVTLSSFRGDRPVALIFGSYT